MRHKREQTELQHYFAIKSDLATAMRAAAADDIDFHLNELAVMQMHTPSDRLRQACRASVSGHAQPGAAILA